MPDEAPGNGEQVRPSRSTLAERVDWLFKAVHPPNRGPYSDKEVAERIGEITGEPVSHSAIWKLRTGKTVNPTLRVIEGLSKFFSVPPAFFFEDETFESIEDQLELLKLLRDTGVASAQLRAFLTLTPEARQAVADLIEATARREDERSRQSRSEE